MQRKSILTILLYLFIGNSIVLSQNNSLQEIKLNEFGMDAFVNFEDVMDDKNIFLIGEDFEHELKKNDFQYKLIEYLNKKEDVHGILLERGISEMYFINKYINGESTKYLEIQEEHYRERDITFFQFLRSYNEKSDSHNLQIMGVGVDKFPEMEILYLNELMANSSSNNGLKNKVQAAASKIYSINNFTEALIKDNEFSSVDETVIDYDALITKLIQFSPKTYEIDQQNSKAFLNFTLNRKTTYTNPSLVVKNNYSFYHSKYPNLKYYAYLPWCNLERERGNRECGVYAYSTFINNKEEYKVYAILSHQVLPHSLHKRAVQFHDKIILAAENNYEYSGFQPMNDSKIDYVVLTKSTVSSSRKVLYLEQLANKNYISFYFNYGLIGYVNNDVEALNSSIKNMFPGFSDFKTELGRRFVDLTFDYKGYVTKISHKWTNQDPVLLDNDYSVELKQASTIGYFGYNFLRHKRNMIAPMIGLGYAKTSLEYLKNETPIDPPFPPFKQFENTTYENPGFIVDYMIDIIFATRTYVGLGFNIGYVTDLSSNLWKLNGQAVSNTPKMSNSGFHAGFSVLLNLNKNLK